MRIEYEVHKKITINHQESPRITEQWQRVINQCENQKLGEVARARLALNTVDYITSSDLPFRLLITRSPQAIDRLSREQKIHKRPCHINGRHGGTVYMSNPKVENVPEHHNYSHEFSVSRWRDGKLSTGLGDYPDIFKALDDNRYVTPLDGIIFWNMKRIAAEIAIEKRHRPGLSIAMQRVDVMDSFTGTMRKMACYHLG